MTDVSPVTSPNRGDSYLYMAAAFVVVVAGLRAAESIINPCLLAVFLSVVSAPVYSALLRRGVSVWLALLTVVSGLTVLLLGVLALVMGSIASFTAEQDYYQERLAEEKANVVAALSRLWPEEVVDPQPPGDDEPAVPEPVSDDPAENENEDESDSLPASDNVTGSDDDAETALNEPVGDSDVPADDSTGGLSGQLQMEIISEVEKAQLPIQANPPPPPSAGGSLMDLFDPSTVMSLAAYVAGSLGRLLGNTLLILLTVIFILLEAGTFERKLDRVVEKSDESRQRARKVIASIHHYFLIKTAVSLATGFFVGVWVWWVGVSHAPLWALLAFLFNYIPNVGSIVASIPAILVAWLELGVLPAVAVGFGYVLVNATLGSFIEPRLMGKSLGLSPLIVFISMVFWGWVLGPTGMLLSVPITMTARIALDGFDDTRWIATLMGQAD